VLKIPITTRIQQLRRLTAFFAARFSLSLGGLILASWFLAGTAAGQTPRHYTSERLEPPRSTLGQPFDAPAFLAVYGQLGGGFKFEQGQLGCGTLLVFRPGQANRFFNFLYDWNSSLVCQIDYQKVAADLRILSGDLIIRRYFQDMRDPATRFAPFLGAGIGASDVVLPPGAGKSRDRYWSGLIEFGQEWNLQGGNLLFVKGQLRYYDHGGYNYSTWSFQVGAGIPVPW
jgi:hypothetical protein